MQVLLQTQHRLMHGGLGGEGGGSWGLGVTTSAQGGTHAHRKAAKWHSESCSHQSQYGTKNSIILAICSHNIAFAMQQSDTGFVW